MSKSNSFENSHFLHVFQNAAIANIGNAGGLQPSGVAGSLFVALHTAYPGETGDQTTSEATYTGYARMAVARSAGGWTVSGTNPTIVSNAALVTFAQCTAGSNTITHWSIGLITSGASVILYKGPLGTDIAGAFTADVANLVTCPAHGLVNDNRVAFYPTFAKALPTGVTEGQLYFVIATGLTTDAFKFSATSGGSEIDITTVGGGMAIKAATLAVSAGVTPEFAIGAIVVSED